MDRKAYDQQRDAERKIFRFVPTWYGVVFGFRGIINDLFKDDLDWKAFMFIKDGRLLAKPEFAFKDPDRNADEVTKVTGFLSAICKQSYCFDNQLLTFHNGNADSSCQHNGYHWHWMVHAKVHPTRDARWGRNLLDTFAKPSQNSIYISSETVRDVPALARHILTSPRIPMFQKGEELQSVFDSAGETGFDPQATAIAHSKAKVTESKLYHRMTFLMTLMDKYMTPDMTTLKIRVKQNQEEWNQMKLMMAEPSWETLTKKSMRAAQSQSCIQADRRSNDNKSDKRARLWDILQRIE